MAKIIGRQFQFGVSKETTRGTTPGSVEFWQPFTDLTLDEKKKFAVENQAYGIIEDQVGELPVTRTAEGSAQGLIGDQTIGLLLLSIFGTDTVATHSGESAVYDHTFTVQEATQHQSLSFYVHDPATSQDYSHALGVVEKIELTYDLGKMVTFNASIKAKTGTAQSAYTVSTVTENHFVPQYLKFQIADTLAGLNGTLTATGTAATTIHVTALSISTGLIRVGMTVTGTNIPAGATVAKIVGAAAFDLSTASTGTVSSMTFGPALIALKTAKLTINQNIESQEVLGSQDPADYLNKQFSVEGTVEAIWQNETDFKTPFIGATYQAIRLLLVNSDVTIGSATNPTLSITLAKVILTDLGRPIKVGDLVYQTLKFNAVYSQGDAQMVTALLTNTVSAY